MMIDSCHDDDVAVSGQLELFQKGISEMSNEDNELGEDPNLCPANVDGEEGPLNGLCHFHFVWTIFFWSGPFSFSLGHVHVYFSHFTTPHTKWMAYTPLLYCHEVPLCKFCSCPSPACEIQDFVLGRQVLTSHC